MSFIDEMDNALRRARLIPWLVMCIMFALFVLMYSVAHASEYTDEQIANAIYKAEGGAKTKHPYGILAKYKHTTPRQACINTIKHARRDWNGKGDFIAFLGSRYCPVGASNDPWGLNKNWVNNVKYFLAKDAQ